MIIYIKSNIFIFLFFIADDVVWPR